MASGGPRLGEIEPRERVGAQTSRKYEYQYERTARATLDLLDDTMKHVCVYCDWHDDYVVETGDPPTCYKFHQVKGRNSSQGPWKFSEFFGVPPKAKKPTAKKPVVLDETAIIPRMILHHANFGPNCAALAFVTNSGIESQLSDFLETLGKATELADLAGEQKEAFAQISHFYLRRSQPLAANEEVLFRWLKSLAVHRDQGQIESADAALLEIGNVVSEYSEVDLGLRQAMQIAREILDKVRRKVAHRATIVPTSDILLRQDKGIVVTDLLSVLSLSTEAYEELKAGVATALVKNLSRLHRFCTKNQMTHSIVSIANFKARWDVWRTVQRHNVASVDFSLLEDRVHQVLQGNLTLNRLAEEAKDIAQQFENIGAQPLEPEIVLGLIFSKAAQSEAL